MISSWFLLAVKLCLSASIVTAAVLLLRLVLRKAPRAVVCALWALVALRLVIPVLPKSSVSLIPNVISDGKAVEELSQQPVEAVDTVWENDEYFEQLTVKYRGQLTVHETPQGEKYVQVSSARKTPPKTFRSSVVPILAIVWIAGAGIMLLYMLGSYLRLRRKLRTAALREPGVWESDEVSSPFLLGLIRPRIYLPSSLSEEEAAFVLAHERTHMKRGDHIWKPLGFVLLAVYWFNPLFWLAYFLLCRDIESACDEKVIRGEDAAYRKAYSETLLSLNVRERAVSACPLAFAENGVKERIQAVLSYRKPAFWLLAAALVISVVAAGCALTDPATSADPTTSAEETGAEPTPAVTAQELFMNKTFIYEGEGFGGNFYVSLAENGRFQYYEGGFSSFIGTGDWSYSQGVLTLELDPRISAGRKISYRFSTAKLPDELRFLTEGSDKFGVDLENGARFLLSDTFIPVQALLPEVSEEETFIVGDDTVRIAQQSGGYTVSAAIKKVPMSEITGNVSEASRIIPEQIRNHKVYDSTVPNLYVTQREGPAEAAAYVGHEGLQVPYFPYSDQKTEVRVMGAVSGSLTQITIETENLKEKVRVQLTTYLFTEAYEAERFMMANVISAGMNFDSFRTEAGHCCVTAAFGPLDSGYQGLTGYVSADGVVYSCHTSFLGKNKAQAEEILHAWAESIH